VERALISDGMDAVVITHGTDTIEETAFFLELTVRSNKPIILVGAARPSNNPSADGPDNIRQAVQVAIHPQAVNRGVMVVFHGKIFPAFDVTEMEATRVMQPLVDRFSAPHFGLLGEVDPLNVKWFEENQINKTNFREIKFPTNFRKDLPKVPILLQYVGVDNSSLLALYRSQGVNAFVVAGYGMGSGPSDIRNAIADTLSPNSREVFFSASRTKKAVVDPNFAFDPKVYMKGMVYGGTLSPFHTKTFLQLILAGMGEGMPEISAITDKLGASATLREKVREISTELLYRRMGYKD
jgi:L-asparaginase